MDNLINLSVVAGLVMGICQCIKLTGLNTKWLPLCGLAIGVILSFMIPEVSLFGGMIASLSAFGLYRKIEVTAGK